MRMLLMGMFVLAVRMIMLKIVRMVMIVRMVVLMFMLMMSSIVMMLGIVCVNLPVFGVLVMFVRLSRLRGIGAGVLDHLALDPLAAAAAARIAVARTAAAVVG